MLKQVFVHDHKNQMSNHTREHLVLRTVSWLARWYDAPEKGSESMTEIKAKWQLGWVKY